jgi:acid stress chaperone HdeB
MLKLKPILLGSMFAVLAVSVAQAQVTIDVSKITCDQYLSNKVASSRTVAVWLSGFYAGKRNSPVVDPTALERNADKVYQYCGSNPNLTLMQAVETALGASK